MKKMESVLLIYPTPKKKVLTYSTSLCADLARLQGMAVGKINL
jgi:hypothetical protein